MEQHPEFPLEEGLCYLNHAAVAPWPLRTAEAVRRFTEENLHLGSKHYPQWMAVEGLLREQLQRLINAPTADDIALLKNTSEGLSLIAYGLDWLQGENIVIAEQEFPSNRIVWESLASQGVETRMVDISGDDPEQALIDQMNDQTRLLSVSTVQYGSGLRPGSRYFCESLFWASKPKQTAKLNATVYAYGAPTSCVRCVITSSRLYTTPSVTLRRHKAAAHLLRRSLALSTTNRQTASTIGD
ncbi:aminotransferase class V-fold PLP-dependent enzyme [Candidatus Reidiella endopervernicosa]|uniref:Aminotransferase class V-fold PLP-dependent enzyme n=1 Tax=Candidatus Reidiella endopervernicosa TaxID=2738883 RepID=A0A6N0HX35_9GAMM|nr:aminotransferase class V-fold PLP-dependent enzyme [Candidatus Reidiella endopervernicosa]